MEEKIKKFFGHVLWKLRWVPTLMLIALIYIGSDFLNHKIHQVAQYNKTLHEIVMTTDGIAFMFGGGDKFGYQNYYKYQYAKWRADPERTRLQKIMFWDKSILYDASDPPDEYQYPFLGKK